MVVCNHISTYSQQAHVLWQPQQRPALFLTGHCCALVSLWEGLRPRQPKGGGFSSRMHALSGSTEPDWEAEMSLFRKRTLQPNQLETLRKIEEEVDVGKVMFASDGLAIIEGLNNDAPVGTLLSFVSGAQGVLLWRRNDNICFALLLGGSDSVSPGEGVQCKVKAILQVVDEAMGAVTQREYELSTVPAGDALKGQTVDFFGRPLGSQQQLGTDATVKLLNDQPDMDSREQIKEAITTGVKAVDILTPLGRGQCLLLTGTRGSGKTLLAADAILAQRASRVRCVYAAVGCSRQQLESVTATLRDGGALATTTIVAAPEGTPLGQQYAALCTACAIAERTRDSGGHALVILDDISCMVRMWEHITSALAGLGPGAMELSSGDSAALGTGSQEALVEYEGMLVSAAAAQRRRFFSSLLQRAAKMHRRLKGGSLTMIPVLPGVPASGKSAAALQAAQQYKHLSGDQKVKLLAALQAKAARAEGGAEGDVRTEVIEEFMSIADGQVVLQRHPDIATRGIIMDPQQSVSRIGSRAFPRALQSLAPQIRFELMQAQDAGQFALAQNDPVMKRKAQYAAAVQAVLSQRPGHPVTLEEEVLDVIALQKTSFLEDLDPADIPQRLEEAVQNIKRDQPQLLEEIKSTRQLTAKAVQSLMAAFFVFKESYDHVSTTL